MNRWFLSTVTLLAVLVMGIAIYLAPSTQAMPTGISLECTDQVDSIRDLRHLTDGLQCNKSGTCTAGDTWCETRTVGARSATCTAGGTWGAWVGCGRGTTCTTEGHNGKC